MLQCQRLTRGQTIAETFAHALDLTAGLANCKGTRPLSQYGEVARERIDRDSLRPIAVSFPEKLRVA